MNEILKIKVHTYNDSSFIKKMWSHDINIWNIFIENKDITCNIYLKDLINIKKYYHVTIIGEHTKSKYLKLIKNNSIKIITLLWIIFLFLILSNVIINVNIESDNQELVKDLTKELDTNGIKRLTLKRSYLDLNSIKEHIKTKLRNRLEWLEIENNGMNYTIKLEMRKSVKQEVNANHCHVIASTDGIITNISSTSGTIMVKNNQFVKDGDILISGNVLVNDEIKKDICASGSIYAEKWYSITVDIPSTYEEKEYTKKVKHNFLLEYDNRDYKILKSRYETYDITKKLLISLLGKKLYLLNEYEYKYVTKNYTENELDERINDIVIEKLKLSLNDGERLLYKNILKKEVNDSRIRVELFVSVEKLISKQITY